MRKYYCAFIILGLVFFSPLSSLGQYILNGNAIQESCNCYQLTTDKMWQGGSVWQSTKIDLNDPFDFKFNVFLGYLDPEGADGIVFMLQQQSANLSAQGGGMGFEGVTPSVGIALDTWQNLENNDPVYDHISIQKNGIIKHGNDLAGPIPASATNDNIEDGAWHVLQIKWDPGTKTLSTYFDGVFRLSTQTNLIADIFNNDPMVYWGFSAATGGKYNIQKFCTALNPIYSTGLTNNEVCHGTPVDFKDSSTSFTTIKSYFWDFGDGTTSDLANPPPHVYADSGSYKVSHYITAMDNCESPPFTRIIKVGDDPVISFHVLDTCEAINPVINVDAKLGIGTISKWQWQINGNDISNSQKPDLSSLSAGEYSLKLTATSSAGCVSNSFVSGLTVKPRPNITANINDGCINIPVSFNAQQNDFLTSVKSWHWDFGDHNFSDNKTAENTYSVEGNYPVRLTAEATNGCANLVSKNLFINAAHANAGKDTLVVMNTPFQLEGSGGSSYSWTPPSSLNDPFISNPIGKLSNDVRYLLTVKTPEGCVDTASVNVSVFKGSAIYVPTAFTPNNDGLNDILKPYYVAIKSLSYFTVFNRWGQKVFSTNDLNKGWDGLSKDNEIIEGSYVWVLKAVDAVGKIYSLKGSFVLIK
ncbi:MAG: lectin-like domain-containing protein [Ginsengibacter sp.]